MRTALAYELPSGRQQTRRTPAEAGSWSRMHTGSQPHGSDIATPSHPPHGQRRWMTDHTTPGKVAEARPQWSRVGFHNPERGVLYRLYVLAWEWLEHPWVAKPLGRARRGQHRSRGCRHEGREHGENSERRHAHGRTSL